MQEQIHPVFKLKWNSLQRNPSPQLQRLYWTHYFLNLFCQIFISKWHFHFVTLSLLSLECLLGSVTKNKILCIGIFFLNFLFLL